MFNLTPWKKRQGMTTGESLTGSLEHELARLRDDVQSLLHRMWGEGPLPGENWFRERWGLDWQETEAEYVVRAEAPGFEAQDMDVQVRGPNLVIRAQRKEETTGPAGSSHHYGRYERVIPLPPEVDSAKIEARYHSGVLELHLPKGEAAHGRRITVKPT